MSCVSFLSEQQRAQLRSAAGERLSPEEIRAIHPTPPVTESKVRRLRLLAQSPDPRIRESAALNHHCPADVLTRLAEDDEPSVRTCVARQPAAPPELLARLAADPAPQVRTWVAANPSVSEELLDSLAEDDDETVRRVVAWARAWPQRAQA